MNKIIFQQYKANIQNQIIAPQINYLYLQVKVQRSNTYLDNFF